MKSKLALQVRRGSTLREAWLAIKRNSRTSKSEDTKNEIAAFEAKSDTNLKRISSELRRNTFVFPPAKGVKVLKDKSNKSDFRPLVVAKVESRIVQRAIHDVLIEVPALQGFVRTPYSFGGIRKKDDELTAVPAAISSVLESITSGSKFMIKCDISGFFTKIPKSYVTDIVQKAVNDDIFIELFKKAIAVELENMAQLRGAAKAFPIQDIGVAQGNSLSPLLGNIILHDFDRELNKHKDVKCIRYIDDFIILGPSQQIVENKYSKAIYLLDQMGMNLSHHKTKKSKTDHVFNFLGIEFANGLLRPSVGSRTKMLGSIDKVFLESIKAFRRMNNEEPFDLSMSLLKTLNKISGIMQGWAKHYRFCNDGECLRQIDIKISEYLKNYLAIYREERSKVSDEFRWKMLGIESISQIERTPFLWSTMKDSAPSSTSLLIEEASYSNDLPWN